MAAGWVKSLMRSAEKKIASPAGRICFLAIGLLVLALALRRIHDLDLGFHLRGGQWLLQHHSFHRLDVFTYTVNHHEYIAMYWLFQIALYAAYLAVGYGGLTIINALAILLIFYLLGRRLHPEPHGRTLTAAALILSVLAMELRFGVRPEIATWFFLSVQLLILEKFERSGKNLLFLLPLSQLFWVNTHGLFILGGVVMAAYAVGFFIHDRVLFKKFYP